MGTRLHIRVQYLSVADLQSERDMDAPKPPCRGRAIMTLRIGPSSIKPTGIRAKKINEGIQKCDDME